jgi:hypothetical protein
VDSDLGEIPVNVRRIGSDIAKREAEGPPDERSAE